MRLAERSLPRYGHKYSPQRFTLPQLAACVWLKEYRQLDWRGIQALLELSPPLRQRLGLRAVPDYSMLWRFARRWLDTQPLGRLLGELVGGLAAPSGSVAGDSTGLDPDRTSS